MDFCAHATYVKSHGGVRKAMFGPFKKKTPEPTDPDLREMLFGDVPVENWKPAGRRNEHGP